MKKALYIIVIGFLGFVGFTRANVNSMTVAPTTQSVISGSLVTFTITGSNGSGNAYLRYVLPKTVAYDIVYQNSNATPSNNWLLSLGIEHDPVFSLPANTAFSISITAKVMTTMRTIPTMNITADIAADALFSSVLTSAVAQLTPIADLTITNILTGANPSFSGDNVYYSITLQNIGSDSATGITFISTFPLPTFYAPTATFNGALHTYNYIDYPKDFVRTGNYLNILNPGQTITILLNAAMTQNFAVGTTFNQIAKAMTASAEYTTGNNSATATGVVQASADVWITKTLTPFTGYTIGDNVIYTITYGNNGGKVASGVVLTDIINPNISLPATTLTIGTLPAGSGGTIILTGTLTNLLTSGYVFANTAKISTTSTETNTGNNSSTATGTIQGLANVTVDIIANNLTRAQLDNAPYGSGPSTMIQAVSGDIVQFTITYANHGNATGANATVGLSGIQGLVSLSSYTSTLGTLQLNTTGTLVVTGIVGPKNYISFTPVARLSYNGNQLITDSITVQEPFVCGDGLITRTETCDGVVGVLYSGQVCNSCTLVTQDIINAACVNYQYTNAFGGITTGQTCASVTLPLTVNGGQCKLLSRIDSASPIVIAQENTNNNTYDGQAQFTCESSGGILASTIVIDCGNGEVHTGYNVGSYSTTCHFTESTIPQNRNVSCSVDTISSAACQKSLIIDQGGGFGICGNGIVEEYEDCDEYGMQPDETINGCKNCDLVNSDMVACFNVGNTNLSVQENEILPYRRTIDNQNNLTTQTSCNTSITGKIRKNSMQCEFVLYNGTHTDNPIVLPTVNCNEDTRDNQNIFKYLTTIGADRWSLQHAFGKYSTVLDDASIVDGTYGEYKLALQEVRYQYCDGQNRIQGTPVDRVCEVNFAVTKPYLAQKSTFGLTPKATSINLEGFKDILGEDLVRSTDLADIMVLDESAYAGGSNVQTMINTFITKYTQLGITIANADLPDSLKNLGITVKVVPKQKIYILQSATHKEITMKNIASFTAPFTIVTKNIDVVIKGNVDYNGMFLVKDGTIKFEKSDEVIGNDRCPTTQTVKGIFVTDGGFVGEDPALANTDPNEYRCNNGGLYVKGILIGNGIDDLVQSKRSQLNHRFMVGSSLDSSVKTERRNEIFNGASVLIEYSPSLWSSLPPGASDFTKALDIYKQ